MKTVMEPTPVMRLGHELEPWRRRHGERGVTMLITLGFMAVMLMLALTLAMTSRTETRAAAVNADLVRSRLLAESALSRVLSLLESEYAGELFPGAEFYTPTVAGGGGTVSVSSTTTTTSPWGGRRCLASTSANDQAGIEAALAVRFADKAFTPEATLDAATGWVGVPLKRRIAGQERDTLVGRFSYVVIDESGKLDPSALVSPDQAESTTVTRTGASPSEISLASAGFSSPDRFRPTTVNSGTAGSMPAGARWFSMSHLIRALNPSQTEVDQMVKTLYPLSYDVEKFWRDTNNNGVWDAGEDEERLDLTGPLTLAQVYDLFLGPDKNLADDDCAWLKELDRNTWVQSWRQMAGLSTVQARQRIAGRIAANILDFIDPDSIPTPGYVDTAGNIGAGSTDVPGTYSFTGVERTWGVSELAMRVDCEIIYTDPPPGTCTILGDLNINPGNSWHEFILTTPTGEINKDTLMANMAGFTYSGPASSIKIKVKAQGRTLTLNGKSIELDTNEFYTIRSSNMQVFLRNLNPTAKNWAQCQGHWWLKIDAKNATIDPDPGVPPAEPIPTALKVTPSIKGEIFYPFATNANQTDAPGDLAVAYVITVLSATGKSGTCAGNIIVPMTGTASADGGTLMYSTAWTDGEATILSDAFDVLGLPPAPWYSIQLARINAATLHDAAGNVIDSTPLAAAGDSYLYLADWCQNGTNTVSGTYYASVAATDALHNDVGKCDLAFSQFWSVQPNAVNLATTDVSGIGALSGTGYQSSSYCDVAVNNTPPVRTGDLGRLHSYQPMRSLRFWAASTSDEVGHDAAILDLFRMGPALQKHGKVNINTLEPKVLEALFAGATGITPAAAATTVLNKRNSGTTFRNVGELLGGVSGLYGSTLSSDDTEEALAAKLAEMITVRPNYFSVVVCAQVIGDVGGVRYDSDGDGIRDKASAYNVLDVKRDSTGKVVGYFDRILAEHKLLATVYRDAFSNRLRVDQIETIRE